MVNEFLCHEFPAFIGIGGGGGVRGKTLAGKAGAGIGKWGMQEKARTGIIIIVV